MDKAIFLDKDGTLVYDSGYVHKVEDFRLLPSVIEGLKILSKDFTFIVITNQSGIGRGIYTVDDTEKFNKKLVSELNKEGISIKKIYYCPHIPDKLCECRKPGTKHIMQAVKELNLDIQKSWVIGDHPSDIIMGINSGCKNVYLLTGHGKKHIDNLKKDNIKPNFVAEKFIEAAEFIMNNIDPKK